MDTFDVSPVPAFESDTLPAHPDVIHVPTVAAGAKRKGRPLKVAPPSMSLFAAAIGGGRYWLGVDRDDDSGMAVRVFTGDVLLSVDYHGPSDRTLVPELKNKRGCYSAALDSDALAPFFRHGTGACATLDAASVSSALDYLMPAMSTDLTRYNLNAVYLDTNGKWVATDGHRLHLVTGMDTFLPRAMIVPAAAIRALSKAIKVTKALAVGIEDWGDAVTFNVHGEHLSARITARLVDGKFPDYTQVIPSEGTLFDVDADSLRDALKRAPLVGDKNVARRLVFENSGGWTQRHDGTAVALPFIGPWNFAFDGKFNARYLSDMIEGLEGCVTFSVGDEWTPLKVTQGRNLSVVMPVRK